VKWKSLEEFPWRKKDDGKVLNKKHLVKFNLLWGRKLEKDIRDEMQQNIEECRLL
jgi:hypothetical protein